MNPQDNKKVKLLLVEDDRDFSLALSLRLNKRNFEVTVADTGEAALEKLQNSDYDIIVSDIKLPGIDGIRFLAKVREISKDLPVILLTGYGSLDSAKEAVRLNATDYLLKPLDNIDDLLHPINRALYSYKLVKENEHLTNNLKIKIEELSRSEHKYRDLFESASDIIYTVNCDGIITSVNKRMEEITGYRKNELIGRLFSNVITPIENRKEIDIKKFLAGKITNLLEVKIATNNGKEKLGEIGVRPVREENAIIGAQCIIRDITERKKAEIKLKEAYNKLKEAQTQLIQAEKMEAIGTMASGVAHEVKNPLGSIMQGVNYLEEEYKEERKDIHEMFDIIKNNVKRADNIICTLLDFSRASKLEMKVEDINVIINNCLMLMRHNLNENNVKVIKELNEALPKVLVDKGKIEQVIVNLLLNAIQAMSKEGTLFIRSYLTKYVKNIDTGIEVGEKIRTGEKIVFIEIEDTGVGIPEESLHRVFDPFFTTKRPGKGTGLGLTVISHIINLHKGLIKIESKSQKGTKITIGLKIAKGIN